MTTNKIRRFLLAVVVLTWLASCTERSEKSNNCRQHYKIARAKMNAYYQYHDQSLIQQALQELDSALPCHETHFRAVNLKIGILGLNNDFKKAYDYVRSLHETDFIHPYQKTMYADYFLASDYGARGDTISRNKLLQEAASAIEDYIQKQRPMPDTLDQLAYGDLYFIKTQFISPESLAPEIDSLKKKFPKDSMLLDAMKASSGQSSTSVSK